MDGHTQIIGDDLTNDVVVIPVSNPVVDDNPPESPLATSNAIINEASATSSEIVVDGSDNFSNNNPLNGKIRESNYSDLSDLDFVNNKQTNSSYVPSDINR